MLTVESRWGSGVYSPVPSEGGSAAAIGGSAPAEPSSGPAGDPLSLSSPAWSKQAGQAPRGTSGGNGHPHCGQSRSGAIVVAP